MANKKFEMPKPEASGFIKTLNGKGYMTSALDPFSQEFVAYSKKLSLPVLEIGAAYGVASIEALSVGAKVIANDLDQRHLDILIERTPESLRKNLIIKQGEFPNELRLEENSLGAVLICRVMHFFDGSTIELAATTLSKWLVKGGKAFVVAETPYLKNFENFIPIFEERLSKGTKWPGFIDDVMKFDPIRGKALPKQMHFLDPHTLSRVFVNAGFIVERAETFARGSEFPDDIKLDGRESMGLVAVKQ